MTDDESREMYQIKCLLFLGCLLVCLSTAGYPGAGAVRSTHCSCRGPEFPAPTWGSSPLLIATAPRDRVPLVPEGTHTHGNKVTHRYTYVHTHGNILTLRYTYMHAHTYIRTHRHKKTGYPEAQASLESTM